MKGTASSCPDNFPTSLSTMTSSIDITKMFGFHLSGRIFMTFLTLSFAMSSFTHLVSSSLTFPFYTNSIIASRLCTASSSPFNSSTSLAIQIPHFAMVGVIILNFLACSFIMSSLTNHFILFNGQPSPCRSPVIYLGSSISDFGL